MAREIVLDTETTGFDPKTGDRLIEIACIEIDDLLPTGRTFHRYQPRAAIPPDAKRCTASPTTRSRTRRDSIEIVTTCWTSSATRP